MFGGLRQVRLPVKLIAGDVQLDPVVAPHLVLAPHPHAVLELEVEGLEELEVDPDSLLGGQLVQLTGGRHADWLPTSAHHGIFLFRRCLVLRLGQGLEREQYI